jgi:hypothetical protein
MHCSSFHNVKSYFVQAALHSLIHFWLQATGAEERHLITYCIMWIPLTCWWLCLMSAYAYVHVQMHRHKCVSHKLCLAWLLAWLSFLLSPLHAQPVCTLSLGILSQSSAEEFDTILTTSHDHYLVLQTCCCWCHLAQDSGGTCGLHHFAQASLFVDVRRAQLDPSLVLSLLLTQRAMFFGRWFVWWGTGPQHNLACKAIEVHRCICPFVPDTVVYAICILAMRVMLAVCKHPNECHRLAWAPADESCLFQSHISQQHPLPQINLQQYQHLSGYLSGQFSSSK